MPCSSRVGVRTFGLGLIVAMCVLQAAGVTAASKYNACSLLTAAEVEAVVKDKISKTDEGDITIPDGPYKGEVMSGCNWAAGQTYTWLSVIRAPRTAAERAEGLAILKDAFEKLKKQGWTIQEREFGGMGCAIARAPAGTSGNPNVASCIAEKGGLALSVGIGASGIQVSMEQAKSLTDKAATRIR